MYKIIKDRRGVVMPSVVFVIGMVTLLGFTVAFLVQSQTTMGMRYTDNEKSLHLAEAGINKYIWHLNKDSSYYKKGSYEPGETEPGVVTPYQDGFYYLEVEAPTTEVPVVTIRATGWTGGSSTVMTTVEAQVHKKQFTQHLFVTGLEELPDGDEVWWITGDEVAGPLHTNGRIYIDGNPVFHGKVTYSGAAPNIRSGSRPSFAYDEDPEGPVPQLAFPLSNTQIKTQAIRNGYYYSGRTSIYLNGDRLKVRTYQGSSWRYYENLPLPPNGVIYVDGTTANVSSPTTKFNRQAGNVFIAGRLDGRLTVAAANDIYITHRDPTNATYGSATSTGGITYADSSFTGNDITDDMLGLVAGHYVRILHKNWPSFTTSGNAYTSNSNVAPQNITIHAAIFALDWAFEFEDYEDGGVRGVINMVGSITQKYRGAVGTFSSRTGQRQSGYLKNYVFDPRMAYETPPHFLEPVNTGWEIVSWQLVTNPTIPEED